MTYSDEKNKLPKRLFCFIAVFIAVFFLFADGFTAAQELEQLLTEMTFVSESHGWQEEKNCRLSFEDGNLCIRASGVEPSVTRLSDRVGGQIRVIIRLRTKKESSMSFYWTSAGSPRQGEDKKIIHILNNDGKWHDYEFVISVADRLTGMSLRFSSADGFWEIASITAYRSRPHPLSLRKVENYTLTDGSGQRQMFRLSVYNDLTVPLKVKADNLFRKEKELPKDNNPKYEFWYGIKTPLKENAKEGDKDSSTEVQKPLPPPFEKISEVIIPDNETVDFAVPVSSEGHLDAAVLTLLPNDFPPAVLPVFRYKDNPQEPVSKYTLPLGNDWLLDVDADARTARIRQKNKQESEQENNTAAVIAPLVHRGGIIPKFKLKQADSKQQTADSTELHFESEDTLLTIRNDKNRVRFIINSIGENNTGVPAKKEEKLEGPVVRLAGTLQSGILPGVEFLGKNEVSSSPVDLIEPYNERSVSPADWLTSKFSFCATDKVAVLLQWNDAEDAPALQAVFSSPDRFDYTGGHRLSLRGTKIDATLEILPPFSRSSGQGAEPAAVQILQKYWAEHSFPEPLPPIRSDEEENALCLKALTNAVQGEDGQSWAYAAEPDWQRKPFADVLSALFRLSGKMPVVKNIVSGSSEIANDASFFLLGKSEQYSKERKAAADSYLLMQNPDGSFFYRTRFSEIENQFTSFGITAVRALEVMEYVRLSGSEVYFTPVQKALVNLSSYDVPRGGFFLDNPLHTPDLYSAAAATWLAVWAYEFSKNEEYLKLAKRFAVTGLPFIYLHGKKDSIMLYAAVSKLGGEGRRLPLSFGVADPQTGIVYAYALHLLSKHDKTFDWNRIAQGICRTAEAIQYPDDEDSGNYAGCIPARFGISRQTRGSWKVNPCSLISLRAALAGKIDSLSVVSDGKRIYAAPFPLKITPKGLEATDVPDGQTFQVLQGGSRIINAEGSGKIIID